MFGIQAYGHGQMGMGGFGRVSVGLGGFARFWAGLVSALGHPKISIPGGERAK